jgi:predicted regulator of Ras-like GTPase activity (Roadblock/LC7/MglB family)
MNVQDVINYALAGQDGVPVTPAEHSVADDTQVTKLAAALNFIGTNLESAFDDMEKEAATSRKERARRQKRKNQQQDAKLQAAAANRKAAQQPSAPATPLRSKSTAPFSEFVPPSDPLEGVPPKTTSLGNMPNTPDAIPNDAAPKRTFKDVMKGLGTGAGKMTGILGTEGENFIGKRGGRLAATGALAAGLGYGANRLFRSRQDEQKTASVDDALYYAAQTGKQSLMTKIAEDRINPAKINAGPAAPYSGELMPASSPVFGGSMMPAQLVAMKAQKVRNRINADMRQYVSNVGDGYNLQGHLNKMNK